MTSTVPNLRRADLDWIRVTAFGLLILFHVSLVYAPWDWHVHSAHTFAWLEEATLATGPWRLTLLFLVSGAALRFMSRRFTAGEVLRARMARLVPPFLFGVLVLVPPQSWLEATAKGSWTQGLTPWWTHEFSPAGLADGVPINHLWFVLYIGVYSVVATALMTRPAWLAAMEAWFARTLTGWRMLVLPMVFFAVVRQMLFPWFGQTNQLFVDWYNHAISLGVFLFGFAVANNDQVWRELERQRWRALAVVAVALPALMLITAFAGRSDPALILRRGVYGIDQWASIVAIVGFASDHLRRADGPVLRYLTDAVFPCYLIHQTLLVGAAYLVGPLALPAGAEALLLVVATFAGSLLVYEAARRMGPLRPLWGLKRLPAPARAPAAEPAEVA